MKALKFLRRMTWLQGKADLGEGPVLAALVKLSIPSIAMVLFHTLFHLVDTVFISWLGETHMVAISYTYPVQIGVFAILEGVGNGMTAIVGRRLGEDRLADAQRTTKAAMGLAYLLCLLWIPFIFPGVSNYFFRALGASDPETLKLTWLYNLWIPITYVLISFSYVTNSVFRCQGNTMVPLNYFIIANSVNLVLDPLFIFVFGWDITGAAAATFIGRAIGTFYLVKKLKEESKISVPLLPYISSKMLPIWGRISMIGLPVTLMSGSVALGLGTVNRILTMAYGPRAVAAWMVDLRVEDLSFNTLVGINNALVPFLAFNYGRRDIARMKKGLNSGFIIGAVVTGVIGLALAVCPHPLIAVFKPTGEVASIAARALRISIAAYPMVIYYTICNSLFLATGYSVFGFVVQILRAVVLRISAAHILSKFVSLEYIWLFQPISFVGATILTIFLSSFLMKKIAREIGK
ncbi:MAG: MATE family efflux transporter [Synergistaceae bacterium]|nr:MATE family efflux transporter [Synergistaceae bacterium]